MSLLDTSGAGDEIDAVEPTLDDPSGGAEPRDGGPPPPDRTRLRLALDVAVVAASALFVFWQLHPDLLLARTTPAGGDMGAHVWALGYLRDHLLPELRLSGWTPDWYAGFPVFQYYMVVPFLAMVVLNTGLAGAAGVLPAGGLAGHQRPGRRRLLAATAPSPGSSGRPPWWRWSVAPSSGSARPSGWRCSWSPWAWP